MSVKNPFAILKFYEDKEKRNTCIRRVFKNGKEIFECPYCGHTDDFYVHTIVKGKTNSYYGYNGKEADNTNLHDPLTYTDQKTAYCSICRQEIGRVVEFADNDKNQRTYANRLRGIS